MTELLDQLKNSTTHFADVQPQGEPAYLIQGLIPYPGLTVFGGKEGTGKTTLAIDMTLRVALGETFRGRKGKKGAVIYMAGEGERAINNLLCAFRAEFLDGEKVDVPFVLNTKSTRLVGLHEELFAWIDTLPRKIKGNIVAIVFDTLARYFTGSESHDGDMNAFVNELDAIRERLQCSVIVIHHWGKKGNSLRGSSILPAAADAVIDVEMSQVTKVITAKVSKMKDGPTGMSIRSKLKPVGIGFDDLKEVIRSCVMTDGDGNNLPIQALSHQRAEQAKELLMALIKKNGVKPPKRPGLPPSVRLVSRASWKKACDDINLVRKGTAEAVSKLRQQTRAQLMKMGQVGSVTCKLPGDKKSKTYVYIKPDKGK